MKARKQSKKRRKKVSATTHLTREAIDAEPAIARVTGSRAAGVESPDGRVTSSRTAGVGSSERDVDTKSLVFGAIAKNRDERNGENGQEETESGESAAFQTASTVANAREVHEQVESERERLRLRLEPGQAHSHSRLTDKVQETICGFIVSGGSWTDACALAAVHRSTATDWKARGQRFLEAPEAHPEDARYAEFVKACAEAELKVKVVMLNRIQRDPDWRAQKWLLINRYPNEFRSEHLSIEQSGPNGTSIPISVTNQPFRVEVNLSGPPSPEFKVVDHRNERETTATSHVESQVIAPPPEVFEAPAAKIAAPEHLSPYDPNAGRLYEHGIMPRRESLKKRR